MGPVRQNSMQKTLTTAHLSVLMTAHYFNTQHNINLPSCVQTTREIQSTIK